MLSIVLECKVTNYLLIFGIFAEDINIMMKKKCLIAIIILLVLAVYAYIDPSECMWMPQCPFRRITGWSCPFCGSQRFVHDFLCGRPLRAFAHNYYLVLALPYLMLVILRIMMPLGRWRRRISRVVENRMIIAFFLITMIAWLFIRNILYLCTN